MRFKNQNAKKKQIFFKFIKIKEQEEIVDVDDNEEYFNEEISLQNDEYDDNIDFDIVDKAR